MRLDLNIGKSWAVSRGWPSGRNTTGLESEKAVATPAKAFSAPGPYCIANTPGGRPLATRANPSAIWTPTRSCRQMTGRIPTAAAASMIGVVGKQNKVETPSRFRISAMTFMTSIGGSSQWLFRVPANRAGRRAKFSFGALVMPTGDSHGDSRSA